MGMMRSNNMGSKNQDIKKIPGTTNEIAAHFKAQLEQ